MTDDAPMLNEEELDRLRRLNQRWHRYRCPCQICQLRNHEYSPNQACQTTYNRRQRLSIPAEGLKKM
jgi:hypothetical protein